MKNSAINNSGKIYSTYNALSSSGYTDKEIVQNLINILKSGKLPTDLTWLSLLSDYSELGELNHIDIIELLGLAHQKSKEKSSISNTDERKHNGIYYTNYSIAKKIAEESFSLFDNGFDFTKLTFLEPCAGIGIFALAYIDTVIERNIKLVSKLQAVINNMFYADIDKDAIKLLKIIIPIYIKAKYKVSIVIPEKNIFLGDALFNEEGGIISKNDLKSIFNKKDGFDLVLTNPPYKLLKANSNKYGEKDNYREKVDNILKFIRKNKVYKYNTGTINLYKLFVEEILESYTNKNGKVGLLIPSTLLSDKHSYDLRNRILNSYSFSTIYTIPEKNNFFLDITQAFCFFSIDKSKTDNKIGIKTNVSDLSGLNQETITIDKDKIDSISTLKEIISTDKFGWRVLDKIHRNKKIKDFSSITNLRGELDLTLDKQYMTTEDTNYQLLRGNGVKEFVYLKDKTYVQNNFVKKLNGKARYLNSDRLVCQQISNLSLKKRLKFTKIPKGIVLGNSCNFITTNEDSLFSESDITIDYLLGILNSLLIDWRFKLTSSNNHIGNYELDELPLVTPTPEQKNVVEKLVSKIITNPDNEEYKAQLNSVIFDIYGLDKEEALYILNSYKEMELANLTKKWLQI